MGRPRLTWVHDQRVGHSILKLFGWTVGPMTKKTITGVDLMGSSWPKAWRKISGADDMEKHRLTFARTVLYSNYRCIGQVLENSQSSLCMEVFS